MLGRVCEALADLPDTQLLARSSWHDTAPIGGPGGQGNFLNGAVIVQTELAPLALAAELHSIESQLGRERVIRWDARVIDIDLLLYDDWQINLPSLTVPHPRMSFRRFVLEPADEIAGAWRHPGVGWTLGQLLFQLRQAPRCVEIRAEHRPVASWLAAELCRLLDCPGDHARQGAVESTEKAVHPEKPAICLAPRQAVQGSAPSEGGELLPTLHPALVIVVEACSSEAVLAVLGASNKMDEEKKPKKNTANFLKIASLKSSGPRVNLSAEDANTIVQEAYAAMCSAWPDLLVHVSY